MREKVCNVKKILVIVVLSLVWSGNVNASLFDIFKEPVEICMDRFESAGSSPTTAARKCAGITKGELKCMLRLIEDGKSPRYALNRCEED